MNTSISLSFFPRILLLASCCCVTARDSRVSRQQQQQQQQHSAPVSASHHLQLPFHVLTDRFALNIFSHPPANNTALHLANPLPPPPPILHPHPPQRSMSTHPAPGKVRLATSSPSTQATTAATLAQLRQIARRAARDHAADILLLPEAYLGGYPRGSAFGCVVGGRSAEGRDEYLRYFEQAVDLGDVVGEGAGAGDDWVARRLEAVSVGGDGGGAATAPLRGDGTREGLESIAAETGVFLVTGCIEKAGGSLYCAVVYVCPKKGVIGKRRKVMPVSLSCFASSLIRTNISKQRARDADACHRLAPSA